jgi:plastocyanin
VIWRNVGQQPHTATSDLYLFDSGPIEPGGTFSFAFNEPGFSPYHCAIHPEMRGEVFVTG